jgi:hypothetical protein
MSYYGGDYPLIRIIAAILIFFAAVTITALVVVYGSFFMQLPNFVLPALTAFAIWHSNRNN